MLAKLKQAINLAISAGLPLPHAYDPVAKQASFRLLTAYISFLVAVGSIVSLHVWPSLLSATITSISFYGLCMIFYMLKKLTGAKIDLDDKKIELSNDNSVDKSDGE